MKLINHTTDRVTLELTRHELHLASALIQEGRISHECDSPEGQGTRGWVQVSGDYDGGGVKDWSRNNQYALNFLLR